MARVYKFLPAFLAVFAVVSAETFEENAANPGEIAAEFELQDLNEALEDVADQGEEKGTSKAFLSLE